MRLDEMLDIDWFVPHLFCADMLAHNLLYVVKRPLSGFAELHLRVKTGKVFYRCAVSFSHNGCMISM